MRWSYDRTNSVLCIDRMILQTAFYALQYRFPAFFATFVAYYAGINGIQSQALDNIHDLGSCLRDWFALTPEQRCDTSVASFRRSVANRYSIYRHLHHGSDRNSINETRSRNSLSRMSENRLPVPFKHTVAFPWWWAFPAAPPTSETVRWYLARYLWRQPLPRSHAPFT